MGPISLFFPWLPNYLIKMCLMTKHILVLPRHKFCGFYTHFRCVMCTNILEVDKSLKPLETPIHGDQGLVVDIRRLHYLYNTCLKASIPPSCYSHNLLFSIASLGLTFKKKMSPKEPISTFEYSWRKLTSEITPQVEA